MEDNSLLDKEGKIKPAKVESKYKENEKVVFQKVPNVYKVLK